MPRLLVKECLIEKNDVDVEAYLKLRPIIITIVNIIIIFIIIIIHLANIKNVRYMKHIMCCKLDIRYIPFKRIITCK